MVLRDFSSRGGRVHKSHVVSRQWVRVGCRQYGTMACSAGRVVLVRVGSGSHRMNKELLQQKQILGGVDGDWANMLSEHKW